MCYLTEILLEKGYEFQHLKSSNHNFKKYKVIVLPLPACDKNQNINNLDDFISIEDFSENIDKNAVVVGGMIPKKFRNVLDDKGIKWFDYFECEQLTILNAMATAEGTIAIILDNIPISIYNSTILITGYGRISRCLVSILKGFSPKSITVVARSSKDLMWASVDGARAIDISGIEKVIPISDIIINTVPSIIFDSEKLRLTQKECYLLDIASVPGGVDFESAKLLGTNVNHALGLPSKYAPKTVSKGIFETIQHILNLEE